MINISLVSVHRHVGSIRFQHQAFKGQFSDGCARFLRSWVSYRATDANIETELDPRQSLLLTPRKAVNHATQSEFVLLY